MWAWDARTIAIGLAVLSAQLLAGCSADGTVDVSSSSGGGGGYTAPAGTGSSGKAAQPMLVDVDPNRTMTAQPGQGVGVFTEYATGGHWHVWWTCDTQESGLGCGFDVTITISGGTITNATGENLEPGDQVAQSSAGQIEVTTHTSTGIDGVRFDTSPGTVITLDARMNGLEDGSLLFFVQDGLVNGGYTGTLTDPLMLEASSPQ
jgi:hypothetical protein